MKLHVLSRSLPVDGARCPTMFSLGKKLNTFQRVKLSINAYFVCINIKYSHIKYSKLEQNFEYSLWFKFKTLPRDTIFLKSLFFLFLFLIRLTKMSECHGHLWNIIIGLRYMYLILQIWIERSLFKTINILTSMNYILYIEPLTWVKVKAKAMTL